MDDIKIAFPLGVVGTFGAASLQEINPLLSTVCAVLTAVYLAVCIWCKLKGK